MGKPGQDRQAAHSALGRVLRRKRPLEDAFEGALREHPLDGARDRAFAWTLLLTALRRRGHLDAVLGEHLKKPLPAKAAPVLDWLHLGAVQILFLDTADHAAVTTSVDGVAALGPRFGRYRGLVNGVLRNLLRNRDRHLAWCAAHPEAALPGWLRARWERAYGKMLPAMSEILLREPPLDVSVKDPDTLRDQAGHLGGRALGWRTVRLEKPGPVQDLPGFAEGNWWVQDLAASAPAALLGAGAGEAVLDLCAAPGGKTLALAATGAQVTAVDRSVRRLGLLEQNLARTGLSATCMEADARTFSGGPFDRILLDAPCTATGTLRRHPDAGRIKTGADIESAARLQKDMLSRALGLLKPGGVLVYAVCSMEPEEGEGVIEAILAKRKDCARMPFTAKELAPLAASPTEAGDVRFTPAHMAEAGGMDGFFIARMMRSA